MAVAVLFTGAIAFLGASVGNPLAGYGYTSGIQNRVSVLVTNAWQYSYELSTVLWNLPFDLLGHLGWQDMLWSKALLLAIRLFFIVVVFAGIGEMWRRSQMFLLYGFVYMGVLSLWAYIDAARFLTPIIPIILVCIVFGCEVLCRSTLKFAYSMAVAIKRLSRSQGSQQAIERMTITWTRYLTSALLILLAASNLFFHLWQATNNHDNVFANWALIGSTKGYGQGPEEYFEAALWAKKHLPQHMVIAARSPFDFYLWAERSTIEYGWNGGGEASVLQALERADIVVEDSYWPQTASLLTPIIRQYPERFQLLYTADGARPTNVYRIVRVTAAVPRTVLP